MKQISFIQVAKNTPASKRQRRRGGEFTKALLKDKRYSDIEKVTEDEEYREKMYKEFGM